MKTIYNQFAAGIPDGQTKRLHEHNGSEHKVSSQPSSEKMKHWNKALVILIFLLLFGKSNVNAQNFIDTYSASAITSSTLTEKTVQGDDSCYYVLSHGQATTVYNNEFVITMISKYTKNGYPIWSRTYGAPGAAGSNLSGHAITIDNGSAGTGNIAVGGFTDFLGGFTDESFVMEINPSTGAVIWVQYWSAANESEGVSDPIFNHESANPGSITAVSVDFDNVNLVNNLFVTILNSGGIIKTEEIQDLAADYFVNYLPPIVGSISEIKARIVESPTNSAYYVIGNRSKMMGGNDIGFAIVPYNFIGATTLYEYSGPTDIYATGMVEDEGAYSGGSPAVYFTGFYMNSGVPNPLVVQVTTLTSSPTFSPLQIPSPFPNTNYLYPTDIAMLGVDPAVGTPPAIFE